MSGRRELRAERTREAILDAASACMAEGGATADRLMSATARAAGISRPTLYRYFADFQALRNAVVDRELSRIVELTLPRIDALTWEVEPVVELVAFVVEYGRAHPILQATLAEDPAQILTIFTVDAAHVADAAFAVIEPHLANLVAEGSFPDVDLQVLADVLTRVALSLIFTTTSVYTDDPARLRAYLRTAAAIVLQLPVGT